jgi:hypothetical protein
MRLLPDRLWSRARGKNLTPPVVECETHDLHAVSKEAAGFGVVVRFDGGEQLHKLGVRLDHRLNGLLEYLGRQTKFCAKGIDKIRRARTLHDRPKAKERQFANWHWGRVAFLPWGIARVSSPGQEQRPDNHHSATE